MGAGVLVKNASPLVKNWGPSNNTPVKKYNRACENKRNSPCNTR